MLKKHESTCTGQRGDIDVTSHAVQVIAGTRPFKSAPYKGWQKPKELEKSEISKQLAAGVIEVAQSAWDSPVLLVPN